MTVARLTVPVEHRTSVFTYALVIVAFIAGAAAMLGHKTSVITHTQQVKETIQQQYGTPSQSVNGATVNSALAGLTCDVYGGAKTVICHP